MKRRAAVALLLLGGCHHAVQQRAPVVAAQPIRNAAATPSAVAAPSEHPELDELSRILTTQEPGGWDPRRLWLTLYRQDQRNIAIEGRALDGEDVAQLLRRLQASAWFRDLVLEASDRDADNITFRVRATSPRDGGALERHSEGGDACAPFCRRAIAPHAATPIDLGERPKLIATLISDEPRAMVSGANGRSWILRPGDVVDGIAARWKVEAVLADRVVLVAEPSDAKRPPLVLRLTKTRQGE
jgi:hypothetical protein